MRTPFQRDRDRIVHSKAFRRLKHKTQVFVAPEGDHYRTRLTHTLEACFISRTVARALGLNEDLTEAIGLGHDLGHPPFGHIGEEVLDEALREHGMRFRHNEHSLRVVEVLARDGRGLNLTEQVRDGILNHTGPGKPATLEGRVVRIVDRVAYINHDIDDAVRAGIISEGDLPAEEIELLGETGAQRIDLLVQDMVERSRAEGDIAQSEEVGGAMLRLRKFMFERVYLGQEARAEQERARVALRTLFDHYLAHLDEVPATDPDAGPVQRVTDYLAGMTDRFCLATYDRLVASAIDWVDGEVHHGQQGSGQGGGGHRRDRLGVHRPAAAGAGLLGELPVPRRADAVVQGQPAGQALLLLRLRGERGRVPVRGGEGGAGLPRGGRVAGGALRRRARAGERGPAGRGDAAAARRGSGSCSSGRRSSTSATCGSRRRRRRRGRTWRSGGWGRRCCGGSASGWRRAPGIRC